MPAGAYKRHAERGEPLFGRLGLGVYHAGAYGALRPDDHGAVPVSLASGNRDKTLEECARCRCVAGESAQPPSRGVAAWEIALCVDAGAAPAASARGQLGAAGSRACKHVVARLGHAQRRAGTDDYRCFILEGGRLGSMPEGVGGTASPEDLTTASSRGARCPLSLRGEQTRGHAHGSLTAFYPEEPRLILARMGGKGVGGHRAPFSSMVCVWNFSTTPTRLTSP